MGDPFGEGYVDDGETPVHMVDLRTFSIDTTTVTNAAFTHFIDATGYVTEAERFESSAVFHLQLPSREDWPEGRCQSQPRHGGWPFPALAGGTPLDRGPKLSPTIRWCT
ncbi:hypothetical protein GCM10027562_03570 [Arthrobacter pigmenti]